MNDESTTNRAAPVDSATAPAFRITRTELVWPGKYDDRGNLIEAPRVELPFQVIEVIEEGRTSREKLVQTTLPLFGAKPKSFAEDGWRNKLIWGENLLVESSLLREFEGKIDLIYLDPPFTTGTNFSISTQIGESEIEATKEPSLIEEIAYRDTWKDGLSSFLATMAPRLALARELLSPTGSLYLHCDWRTSAHLRLLLDEIFGTNRFINEIAWCYSIGGKGKTQYGRKHDTIFFYSKSENYIFNGSSKDVVVERKANSHMRATVDENGREYQEKTDRKTGKVYRYPVDQGKIPDDYWTDIQQLNRDDAERSGYPTQKPERLLRRIVAASSNPDGVVADFYCGSGTTLAAAESLGRRWIGCDLGRFAIHTTRKRLLELRVAAPETSAERGVRAFEILNLGRYERKYWQGITFGNEPQSNIESALAAYVKFILALYKAQPVQGGHVHGKKGSAFVHVGAVDAPVTLAQIEDAVAETKRRGVREVHVLAWEWEMGIFNPLIKHAKTQHGVDLRLLYIPREVMEKRAVEAGDVQFFELAYLEVEPKPAGSDPKASRSVRIRLKDFVIPSTDLIPEEERSKVGKWSDYIDYWAVDWDFRNDTFMSQWQSYRTRRDRSLALETPVHSYPAAGSYQVIVKVIDIFGNDTSYLLRWEAK